VLAREPAPAGIERALALLAGEIEVARVACGADALALARAGRLGAALLDARAGAEVEALVASLAARAVPVLLLEPEPGDAAALRWLRAGAGDCLACSAPAERIAVALRRLLARERARRDAVTELANAHAELASEAASSAQLHTQLLQHEKLASIGQLAAGVAHEINNPMGFIHANLFQMAEYVQDLRRVWLHVEALAQAAEKADLPELRDACEALAAESAAVDVAFVLSDLAKAVRESQEGSERIRHIVQDLRDFSHHDTAERVLADLNQCLDSTANIVWPMMKHVVVLEKRYDPELPAVACFPMQLKQVFMNLLVNAFQAIEEAVAGTGRSGTITLETQRCDGGVRVVVADTGVGIPEAHRGRIFDPFFTTKKVGAGTGLGLSTSFGIAQRHGGSLSVESEPGRGSRFSLFLPVAQEGAAP
jgi:signal transduction histidine kinase